MDKRSANNWYPVLVWLTFFLFYHLISLTIVLLTNSAKYLSWADAVKYVEFFTLLGAPIIVVFLIFFKLFTHSHRSSLQIKLILIAISVVGIFIACYIFFEYLYVGECLIVSGMLAVPLLIYRVYKRL